MPTPGIHEKIGKHGRNLIAVTLAVASLAFVSTDATAQTRFRIQFDHRVHPRPFSGRVYLFFSPNAEPRQGPNWFQPAPLLAVDVERLPAGKTIELSLSSTDPPSPLPSDPGRKTLVFPTGLDPASLAGMQAQAVIRFNPLERQVGTGPGNGYSAAAIVPAGHEPMSFVVDKLVPPTESADTQWTRVLRTTSKLLSEFHHRHVELLAAVRLPPSYFTAPDKRYPVIFEVPGFGGELKHGISNTPYAPATDAGVEFIHVFLDPNCPLGHHVFADSANNGPVGQALVEELIPALDAAYRTTGSPRGRFLTGHSSGGWSSLWLQITYPDLFNGVWSTAPDPVDFRDFQRIDLYREGGNMYVDPAGRRRPLARRGGRVAVWYDDFARMEEVLGPGGQLHSFEAVFSERGADGRPRLLWNRATGVIDTDVAETWKHYDIRLILEQNWPTLAPKLAGKLHVFMGNQDTFYLDGATQLLKQSLANLGSDAVVEIHPGADHSTLLTKELRNRITKEMSARFAQSP